MKILRIFGVVVGLHLLALILIFADPGCSVGRSQTAAPDTTPPPPAGSPITPAPAEAAPSISFSAESPQAGSGLYSPTRPGTPAAAALEAQPVGGVTPATAYVVASGDSLWSIAKRNHIRVSDLAAANDLRAGSMLQPGQKLIIPERSLAGGADTGAQAGAARVRSTPRAPGEPIHYVVRPGESLRAIAHRYHVKLSEIAAANSISDPKTIHPGQELIIPGGRQPAAVKSAVAPAPAPAEAAPAAAPAAAELPRPDQDLDAGLKPSANSDIPVVKVDDSNAQQK